ncbi:MAG: DNA-directed DNA polymerase [archaeon]
MQTKTSLQGSIIDTDYFQDKKNNSVIRLFVKTGKGIEILCDPDFRPYFYVIAESNPEALAKKIRRAEFGESKAKAVSVEKAEKENAENALKLSFRNTSDLVTAREELREAHGIRERREYDLPFAERYLTDRGLIPYALYEFQVREENGFKQIESAKLVSEQGFPLKSIALDIETSQAIGREEFFADPKKDFVIMVSYSDRDSRVITTPKALEKLGFVDVVENEKEMIESTREMLFREKPDVLVTYNGDSFDLPFLKERAHQNGIRFGLGPLDEEPETRRRGLYNASRMRGLQHVDAFQIIKMLSAMDAIKLAKYDLESVYKALFGKEKNKIGHKEILKTWREQKGLEELATYSMEDALATKKICDEYLQFYIELAKTMRINLFEATRTRTGGLVERMLTNRSFELNRLIPNKPNEGEMRERQDYTFQGAYVKEPISGLHERLAVLDFRSFHMSIMASHNMSPETMNCDCCKDSGFVVGNVWFCAKKSGLITGIVKELMEKRAKLRAEMKKHEAGTSRYKALYAQQWVTKILINSIYGYMGFPGARWYSRPLVNALYSLVRQYIKETIAKAEKDGFIAIYSDTDSCFLELPEGKTEKDLEEFAKKINSELPGVMEIEIEGQYKRGLFVTKKQGKEAAKKKYALIDYKDKLKIVGFEYVRRDWARIARDCQRDVIEIVLKEGNPEKAVQIVRERIAELRSGKTKKDDLVIISQLTKKPSEYDSVGPHVSAAKKAIAKGKKLRSGSLIEFIITKRGKSISDRAVIAEDVAEGDYDAEYYIENQLVPAVIRILQELGYSEEDLKQGGRQSGIGKWG